MIITEIQRVPAENVAASHRGDVLIYVYAGFQFSIDRAKDDGRPTGVTALPGQHPSAYKDSHRRNAWLSFLADLGGA